jgi:4-hydroxy-2-oxoheptanedioate aldolase
MQKIVRTLAVALALALTLTGARAQPAHRINRAIELLAGGQPIYYTGSHEGTDGSFEQGVKDAQTWADYISYDMEHAPFDVKGLAEYMKGLVKGGPTKSGHRTPAVIVNVPVNGIDGATVRANAWMFHQVLATGVHGILLCHADSPDAVRAFVEAVRFPAYGGRRGVHGNPTAARIWGVSTDEYAEKADVWPLNPKGELMIGLKLEDKYALENADANTKIPGVAFAEWGPGDMAFSLGVKNGPGPMPPQLQAARSKVFTAVKANHLFFLNSVNADNVVDMIKEGVMIGAANEKAADIGRKFSKRTMPW